MKKLSLENLRLDSEQILQRSELKSVLGGRSLTLVDSEASCKDDACSESNLCGSQCICDLGPGTCFLH